MKKNIAVIFGGRSAEHDVSIITAHTPIINSLLSSGKYNVWPIYIAKNGSWHVDQVMNDIEYFKCEDFEILLKKQKKPHILIDNGMKIVWPGLRKKTVSLDVAFPAMHGTFGEDGSLMGFLRMANIPFVGCDLFSSALAMDKVLTKKIIATEDIPVVPYIWFAKKEWYEKKEKLKESAFSLNWPVFVKPAHLGSSIAITKVKERKELENAIEIALHYDDKVLVEESIENLIEVTLPIMGNEELQLAEIERPLNKTDFFDFKDKYLSNEKGTSGVNNQRSELPAKIDEDLANKVRDLGRKTYTALECSGIARVDFLIESKKKVVYVNEVNTLPGSLYHHNWKKIGISNIDLVENLIKLGEERFLLKENITYSFKSDILKNASGQKLK